MFKLVDYTHHGRRNRSYCMDWGSPVLKMGAAYQPEKVIERRGSKWVAYTLLDGVTNDRREFKTLREAKAAYEN